MVFIFAKTPSDALAGLVKGIDKVVAENKSKKVAAVVNFTGEPTDDYREMIKEFGKKHNIKNVSLPPAPTATASASTTRRKSP